MYASTAMAKASAETISARYAARALCSAARACLIPTISGVSLRSASSLRSIRESCHLARTRPLSDTKSPRASACLRSTAIDTGLSLLKLPKYASSSSSSFILESLCADILQEAALMPRRKRKPPPQGEWLGQIDGVRAKLTCREKQAAGRLFRAAMLTQLSRHGFESRLAGDMPAPKVRCWAECAKGGGV
jgi:hypothetical protein